MLEAFDSPISNYRNMCLPNSTASLAMDFHKPIDEATSKRHSATLFHKLPSTLISKGTSLSTLDWLMKISVSQTSNSQRFQFTKLWSNDTGMWYRYNTKHDTTFSKKIGYDMLGIRWICVYIYIYRYTYIYIINKLFYITITKKLTSIF